MEKQIQAKPGTFRKKRITSKSLQKRIKRPSKYQVVVDETVICPFDSFYEAHHYSTGKYEVNKFLVQQLEGA